MDKGPGPAGGNRTSNCERRGRKDVFCHSEKIENTLELKGGIHVGGQQSIRSRGGSPKDRKMKGGIVLVCKVWPRTAKTVNRVK